MEEQLEKPRKRKGLFVVAAFTLAILALGIYLTREPALPYGFLKKHPVVETRQSKDGKLRIVVLKADMKAVWNDIRAEFSQKQIFSSTQYSNLNGITAESFTLGTSEGQLRVSNDLSFGDKGFNQNILGPELREGYCVVAFTRPVTLFDRLLAWMNKFFGGTKEKPETIEVMPPRTIHV